jgi:PAS domain S-box-containing protein
MTSMVSPDAILSDAQALRAVLDAVVHGLITIDAQGTVCSFNPAAVHIFGYQPEEVIGRNVKMLMPEPYHAGHDGYLRNYLDTDQAKIIGIGREVTARRKDGTIFPIELGVAEMAASHGRRFIGIIRDISEAKELEANKVFLQTLIENIPDGLVTIDESGMMLRVNRSAERMFGSPADELVGRSVSVLIPRPFDDTPDGYLAVFSPTGEGSLVTGASREVTGRRKDGSEFPIDLSVSQMMVDGRRIFAGLMRDISHRKAMERENQRIMDDLARSNQELDNFAYIASHDLKEPLRGVANNANFLKEDYEGLLDERGAKRVNRMVFLCQRLERLVDDLLYFSRLSRQKLSVQRTDLNQVIKDLQFTLDPALREKGAEIVIEQPLPTVMCDLPRITELFRHLIINGVKYNCSPRKRIEIGFSSAMDVHPEAGPETIFHVRDNGIGIPREFHADVFRIFKRLNEEDDGERGTGVGLTFVQKIVERHRGRIWLESEVGSGTTFYFTLNAPQEI